MASQEEVLVKKIAYLQSLDKDLDALENELKALTVTWTNAVSVNECKKRKGNFGAAIKTYLDLFIKLKDEKFFTKEDVTEKRKLYVENDLLWSIPELKDRTTEDKFKAIRAKGYSIIKAMTYGLDPMRTMISFRIQQLRQFRLQAGFEKTGIVEGATSKK